MSTERLQKFLARAGVTQNGYVRQPDDRIVATETAAQDPAYGTGGAGYQDSFHRLILWFVKTVEKSISPRWRRERGNKKTE